MSEQNQHVMNRTSVFNISQSSRAPNILTAAPRPGGYLSTFVSPNKVEDESDLSSFGVSYHTPRTSDRSRLLEGFENLDQWVQVQEGKRVLAAADSAPPSLMPYASSVGTDGHTNAQFYETVVDTPETNYVLSVAISAMMFLAAHPERKLPYHYLYWTGQMLYQIRDDDNKPPINIRAIQKLIAPLLENSYNESKNDLTHKANKSDQAKHSSPSGPSTSRKGKAHDIKTNEKSPKTSSMNVKDVANDSSRLIDPIPFDELPELDAADFNRPRESSLSQRKTSSSSSKKWK